MRIRRLAIAGVALAAALGLTACASNQDGTPSGAGSPVAEATSAAADPAAELAAAAAALSGQSLKVKMSMGVGLEGGGAMAENGDMDMKMSLGAGGEALKFETRKVGDDLYLKFTGSVGEAMGADGKWLHIDSSKLPAGSPLTGEANDPRTTAKTLQAAAQVEKAGDRSFKGVLDMTKSPTVDEDTVKQLGAKATAVPFTAEADEQGRLSEMVIDMESIAPGSGKLTTTYYDFGTAVEVKAPAAGQTKEMPQEMLEIFNS